MFRCDGLLETLESPLAPRLSRSRAADSQGDRIMPRDCTRSRGPSKTKDAGAGRAGAALMTALTGGTTAASAAACARRSRRAWCPRPRGVRGIAIQASRRGIDRRAACAGAGSGSTGKMSVMCRSRPNARGRPAHDGIEIAAGHARYASARCPAAAPSRHPSEADLRRPSRATCRFARLPAAYNAGRCGRSVFDRRGGPLPYQTGVARPAGPVTVNGDIDLVGLNARSMEAVNPVPSTPGAAGR
jgi:hypothetical protein